MPTDEWERGFAAGYRAGMAGEHVFAATQSTRKGALRKTARRAYEPKKKKRKPSAYNKRYGRAFKKLAPKYKKKNGQWKKDGFKRCGAAARKEAKRS